jgi:hypothetical protein
MNVTQFMEQAGGWTGCWSPARNISSSSRGRSAVDKIGSVIRWAERGRMWRKGVVTAVKKKKKKTEGWMEVEAIALSFPVHRKQVGISYVTRQ